VAGVEVIVPAVGDEQPELQGLLSRQLVKRGAPIGRRGVDVVPQQPGVALRKPGGENRGRDGIPGAPGEEGQRARLSPMRQPPLDDDVVLLRIEDLDARSQRFAHGGLEVGRWVCRHHSV